MTDNGTNTHLSFSSRAMTQRNLLFDVPILPRVASSMSPTYSPASPSTLFMQGAIDLNIKYLLDSHVKRACGLSIAELVAVMNAWYRKSKDAIFGSEQNREAYFKSIYNLCNNLLKLSFRPIRSLRSLISIKRRIKLVIKNCVANAVWYARVVQIQHQWHIDICNWKSIFMPVDTAKLMWGRSSSLGTPPTSLSNVLNLLCHWNKKLKLKSRTFATSVYYDSAKFI